MNASKIPQGDTKAETTEVDDWDIVASNGRLLIGKTVAEPEVPPSEDGFQTLRSGFVMDPVYDLLVNVQLTAQGPGQPVSGASWSYIALPCFCFCDLEELAVPSGALVEPIANRPLALRKQLAQAVQFARAIVQSQRVAPAQGPSSLLLAPAGSENAAAQALRLAQRGRFGGPHGGSGRRG
jgi:hypothetical protein